MQRPPVAIALLIACACVVSGQDAGNCISGRTSSEGQRDLKDSCLKKKDESSNNTNRIKSNHLNTDRHTDSRDTKPNRQSPRNSPPKKILYWTHFFGHYDFEFGFGRKPFLDAGCPVSNCLATADRSEIDSADAVLFHMRNVDGRTPLPASRRPHQRYVFFLMEHPWNQWNDLRQWAGYFNLTMTYRLDSDVPLLYGRVEKREGRRGQKEEEEQGQEENHRPAHQRERTDVVKERGQEGRKGPEEMGAGQEEGQGKPALQEEHRNTGQKRATEECEQEDKQKQKGQRAFTHENRPTGNSTADQTLVAWFVSNCKTPSAREEYVQELQRHLKVDIYGKCGPLDCPTGDSVRDKRMYQPCYNMLERRYKFYLSFENMHCRDYVTEKLYNVLGRDVIPIVMGAVDYSRHAPPNSVIDVTDFTSPRHLANYLRHLADHPEAYARYQEWRSSHVVVGPRDAYREGFCRLCEILNDPWYPARVYDDLHAWWGKETECQKLVSRSLLRGRT